MYTAPDFVIVQLDSANAFANSGHCQPGHEVNDIDYGGDDLRNCKDITINGITVYDCYFDLNP